MKKFFTLIFAALMPLLSNAYVAYIDDILYNLNEDEGTAEVTYDNWDFDFYFGAVVIPPSVTYNDKTYSVTSIGYRAFYGCYNLQSITIPESVTSIGSSAFYNCSGLTSINIPNSVKSIGEGAFSGCSRLTSITIGNSVTSIGGNAFNRCSGLQKVIVPDIAAWCGISFGDFYANPLYYAHHLYKDEYTEITNLVIPYGVKSIGDAAFHGCSSLTSITIPESVTSIGVEVFYGCSRLTSITIPESVTSIGNSAFFGCSSLTSITIPESVTSIGGFAFYGCSGLTYIIIPNGMTSIGDYAFYDCSSLTSINLPESLTSIGYRVFYGCSSLTYIIIPNGVTSIGDYAFYGCSGLTFIVIPNSVASIGYSVFDGCTSLLYNEYKDAYYLGNNENPYLIFIKPKTTDITACEINESCKIIYHYAFRGCSSLTSIIIPESVTSIGDYVFYCCSGLTSITIPNNLTSIGSRAFYGCSSLPYIVIPESVTSIGDYAFYDCSSLTSVTIPESVTSIGYEAFYGCKLRNVLVKGTTPPTLQDARDNGASRHFSQSTCHHATLYVPMGCWDAYAFDDGWLWFNNIRETAMAEEQVSMQQAYTLMDAETFTYFVYDPVNDCIGTITSIGGLNEDNPYHSWQVIEVGAEQYLYNMGAKKFAVASTDGSLTLTDNPASVEMMNGSNGIIIGGQSKRQWAFVSNEHLSAEQNIITDARTSITFPEAEGQVYDLGGRILAAPQQGVNIIRYADGTTRKVMIK